MNIRLTAFCFVISLSNFLYAQDPDLKWYVDAWQQADGCKSAVCKILKENEISLEDMLKSMKNDYYNADTKLKNGNREGADNFLAFGERKKGFINATLAMIIISEEKKGDKLIDTYKKMAKYMVQVIRNENNIDGAIGVGYKMIKGSLDRSVESYNNEYEYFLYSSPKDKKYDKVFMKKYSRKASELKRKNVKPQKSIKK
jgi:hypothetical protein